MKTTIFFAFLCCFLIGSSHAQQFLTKRNRFGLSFTSGNSYNSSKSDLMIVNQKKTVFLGADFRFEHQFTGRIALRSGLGFDGTSATLSDNRADSLDLCYYSIKPRAFDEATCDYQQIQQGSSDYSDDAFEFWHISSRKHRFVYMTIPLELLVRTKVYNYNRFYAKAGLYTSFRVYSKAKEQGYYLSTDTSQYPTNTELRTQRVIIRDINVIKESLVVGVGGEHSFGGHSSLFFDVEFSLGISNVFSQNQKNATLFTGKNILEKHPVNELTGPSDFKSNNLIQNQLRVRIGLLF